MKLLKLVRVIVGCFFVFHYQHYRPQFAAGDVLQLLKKIKRLR